MSKRKEIRVKGPIPQEQWELFIQACSDGGLMVMGCYDTGGKEINTSILACSCTRGEAKHGECEIVDCDRRDKDLVYAVLRALKLHRKVKIRFQWVKDDE